MAVDVEVSRYFHDRLAHGVLNRLLRLDQLDDLGLGGGHSCRLSQLRDWFFEVTVVAEVAVELLLLGLLQLDFVPSFALLVVFRFLVILSVLSSNGLLDVRVAERRQQLVVALLLPVQGLILRLSQLLLGQRECVIVLSPLVAFMSFAHRQGVDALEGPVVDRLKGLLLLLKLVDSLPAHEILLLQRQFGQHPVLLLLIEAL